PAVELNGVKHQKLVDGELRYLDFAILILVGVIHAPEPVVELGRPVQLDLEFDCVFGALLAPLVRQGPELFEVMVAYANDQVLEVSHCQIAAKGRPARRRASCSVLYIRQATVIGPTPPGTGVRCPATARASSKATSPTSLVLPSPAGTRL